MLGQRERGSPVFRWPPAQPVVECQRKRFGVRKALSHCTLGRGPLSVEGSRQPANAGPLGPAGSRGAPGGGKGRKCGRLAPRPRRPSVQGAPTPGVLAQDKAGIGRFSREGPGVFPRGLPTRGGAEGRRPQPAPGRGACTAGPQSTPGLKQGADDVKVFAIVLRATAPLTKPSARGASVPALRGHGCVSLGPHHAACAPSQDPWLPGWGGDARASRRLHAASGPARGSSSGPRPRCPRQTGPLRECGPAPFTFLPSAWHSL